MSETPEKKKAHLRYDNVFKTAWTAEFHFIKQVYKNVCKILISIFSWFFHTIFKDLTEQISYPKCSRMHHFVSYRF